MKHQATRRAVLGGVLGAGVAGGLLSPVSTYLRQFAPLSGSVWSPARFDRQSTVDSPHGPASVRYDDRGVPHVSADDEEALYFAVGYVQGTDRLFQLDLQRRLTSGRLSEVVGDVTLESDEFHRQMQFRQAAEATVDHLRGTAVEPLLEAYADGVNAAIDGESLPLEFQLLDYEPEPWTLADTIVTEKLIAWGLTGGFRTLRKARVREAFGEERAEDLFPFRFDDVEPIVRDHHDAGDFGGDLTDGVASGGPVGQSVAETLAAFAPPRSYGSNSWLVDADLAEGEAPIVSNDPHLDLQAPPIWYEMHLDGPDHRVRGVTFPGVPFVIVGENDHGAWGFTNANADVIDFYTYDRDGETYQYGDEERTFDVETSEIEVSGGENEDIELRRSVHGPVVEEADHEVGVAWTGHAATETTLAIYELTHSEGVEAAVDAIAKFESPTQNVVYADRSGETRFQMTGRIPIRRIDGEAVRGNQIFDGSAPEGEWNGFEPFSRPAAWGESSGTEPDRPGFVPFAANPHVANPDYLAAANQQIAPDDQLGYYYGAGYAPPYRGRRIYELLDERVASGEPLDLDFLREVGRDTVDGRAVDLVDPLVAAAREDEDLTETADLLADWDRRMDPDSEAALVFDYWLAAYREELIGDAYEAADLDEDFHPPDGALEQLPPDSRWFDPAGRPAAMRSALQDALESIDEDGHEVYGDASTTAAIEHPLGLGFLGYPDHPRGGSEVTVQNYNYRVSRGGSWEMQVDLDGEYLAILPGGNSGRYFSEHYDDQVGEWAAGEYRSLSRDLEGDLAVEFEGTDESAGDGE